MKFILDIKKQLELAGLEVHLKDEQTLIYSKPLFSWCVLQLQQDGVCYWRIRQSESDRASYLFDKLRKQSFYLKEAIDYLNDEQHTINFVSQNKACLENDFMNEFIEILKINKIPYQATCSKLKEGDDLIQFNLFHHWFAIGYSYYYGCHVIIDLENYVTCHNLEHATLLIIDDISMIEDWEQFIMFLYTDMDFQSGSEIDLNRYFENLKIYGEI